MFSNNEGVLCWCDNGEYIGDEMEFDIFEGVIYKCKVCYYIVGISFWFMWIGFMNYVLKKGVKIIYFILFKLRYLGVCLMVKINVLVKDLELLELGDFWFEGVSCWKWLN